MYFILLLLLLWIILANEANPISVPPHFSNSIDSNKGEFFIKALILTNPISPNSFPFKLTCFKGLDPFPLKMNNKLSPFIPHSFILKVSKDVVFKIQ